MATTTAKTKTPAEADKNQGTAVERARNGELEVVKNESGEAITPAQQDKLNPPRNNDEAQAQAAAVDPSTVAGPAHIEPIGYEAPPAIGQKPDKEPDFGKVARDAVNGAIQTNVRKALNDSNTGIRMAIAHAMGWDNDGVHRVGLRVPPTKDGNDTKLVVEVRKDYEDWQTVTLDS